MTIIHSTEDRSLSAIIIIYRYDMLLFPFSSSSYIFNNKISYIIMSIITGPIIIEIKSHDNVYIRRDDVCFLIYGQK